MIVYSVESGKILELDKRKYVETKLNEINAMLDVSNESQINVMTINGISAWQKETTGIHKRASYKKPITYFQTAYMGENEFILLNQWSPESTFAESKVEFEGIANSLRNISPSKPIDAKLQILAPAKEIRAPEKAAIATSPLPVPEPSSGKSNAAKLIELKSLLDQGLITKQDYETKKAQILKGI